MSSKTYFDLVDKWLTNLYYFYQLSMTNPLKSLKDLLRPKAIVLVQGEIVPVQVQSDKDYIFFITSRTTPEHIQSLREEVKRDFPDIYIKIYPTY